MEELNQKMVQKKNKNFIKFVIKSYFREINDMPLYPLGILDWINFNKKLEKKINRKKLFNMEGLEVIFNSEIPHTRNFEKENRKFLAKLLKNSSFHQKKIL